MKEDRPVGRSCWKTRPPQQRAEASTQIKPVRGLRAQERNTVGSPQPRPGLHGALNIMRSESFYWPG